MQTPNMHLQGNGCPTCATGRYSKVAISWMNEIMARDKIHIQNACNGGEKVIIHDGKRYYVDGFCEETNTIYEFNGDLYHGNPDIYDPNAINSFNKLRYGELYKRTIEREKLFRDIGFNVISIWENDYRKSLKQ